MGIFTSKTDQKLIKNLKNVLGFKPGNLLLYKQAFRHRSAANEIKSGIKNSNERLEFLGDAVIGSIISEYLFKKYPFKDEGFLTKLRSRIVSRNNFNHLSKKLGIDKFVDANSDNKNAITSSINGDAFEALIGAVYIDKGYKKTTHFVINKIVKLHLDIDKIAVTDTDYKSKVIEWVQRQKHQLKFEVIEESNRGNQKLYSVQLIVDGAPKASGKGYSKKQAEQAAAESLCSALEIV